MKKDKKASKFCLRGTLEVCIGKAFWNREHISLCFADSCFFFKNIWYVPQNLRVYHHVHSFSLSEQHVCFFSIFWWYMVYRIPNFLTHPNIIFLVVYPVKRSVGRWSGRSRSAGFPKLRTTMNMSTCLDQQKTKKHNTTYETVRRPLSHKICCPMLDAFYVFFYHGDLRSCGIMMDSVDRNAKNATAQWCLMIYFETESDYRHTFSQDQSQNGACRGNNFWFDILYRISKCCNPIIPSQHVTTIKNQHFPITHLEIAVRTVSTHSWLYLFFSDEYCWKQRLNYLCNDSRFAPTIPINRISPTTKYRMSHLCKIETNNLNYLEDHHTDKWWITTVIVR